MKIKFLWLGKSKDKAFISLIKEYQKRLKYYCRSSLTELKETNYGKLSIEEQKTAEAKQFLKDLSPQDYLVLLDERGKHHGSIEFSDWIQHKMNISLPQIVFVIAGPYGASQELKDRADHKMSLSHMTLTHDMARILIMEQVYRGFTILRGEKYHNE
ncbi:MAG: 23S rRNA (pseudouridine1915-N3)-methyltransferase [Saprospiraceae bacterium]|jgi:23S rRNA (pseudouridine1915-N3)-methyltransferase